MGTYLNNDGLFKKYGPQKATSNKGGEYVTTGDIRELAFRIDLTTLTTSALPTSDAVFFPKMRVQEVEVVTVTAASAGTAIDMGLIATDRTTPIDLDGFLISFKAADMNTSGERIILTAGTSLPAGVTSGGALLGTTTTSTGYVTCNRTDATSFTAGVLDIKLKYYAI